MTDSPAAPTAVAREGDPAFVGFGAVLDAEKAYPGEIARLLKLHNGLVLKQTHAAFDRLAGTVRSRADVISECSLGAAKGVAHWLVSDRARCISTYIVWAMRWHVAHWCRSQRHNTVAGQSAHHGFPCVRFDTPSQVRTGGGNDNEPAARVAESDADRAERLSETRGVVADVYRVAAEIDPVGIMTWVVRAVHGGRTLVWVAAQLGISKECVHKKVRRLAARVNGTPGRVEWRPETVARWRQSVPVAVGTPA